MNLPSVFGHTLVVISLWQKILHDKYLILVCVLMTILPDIDVISFKLGIPYHHFLGHRGFTHSIFFAVFFSLFVTMVFQKKFKNIFLINWFYIFLALVSHTFFDALTNGGLGVALLSPFDNERYFFPWRPIDVSPIGIAAFLSRGYKVLVSEFLVIGIPSIMVYLICKKRTT